mgnify:CR=1 FL=1
MMFRDMMDMIIGGSGKVISAVKGVDEESISAAIKMLAEGKYWIRDIEAGTYTPSVPEELMEAEAGMNVNNNLLASYIIMAPDFDQEAYWETATKNPPLFKRKTYFDADISCERILELDKANMPVVELFNALASAYNLTSKELMSYLVQKL